MDILGLLFEYYLFPILGLSFCIIGLAGFVIMGIRYFRERGI